MMSARRTDVEAIARLDDLVEALRESRREHDVRLGTLDARLGRVERDSAELTSLVREIDQSLVRVATAMSSVEMSVGEVKALVARQAAANRNTLVTLVAALIGLGGALATAFL